MNVEALIWFALMVVFLLIESATVTMLSIWFVAGALAAMIVSLFHGEIWLQATVFVAVSVVLLLLLRPVARKYFTPKLSKTNVDALIGTVGRVTQAIHNVDGKGTVKLGAMEWSARSTDGTAIEKDTLIQVDRIEGVKVFVSRCKEE